MDVLRHSPIGCWRTLGIDPFGLSKMPLFGRNKLTNKTIGAESPSERLLVQTLLLPLSTKLRENSALVHPIQGPLDEGIRLKDLSRFP